VLVLTPGAVVVIPPDAVLVLVLTPGAVVVIPPDAVRQFGRGSTVLLITSTEIKTRFALFSSNTRVHVYSNLKELSNNQGAQK